MRSDHDSEPEIAFRMCGNSGGPCIHDEYPYPVILDLESMSIPDPVQIRFDHGTVLQVARARIKNGMLIAAGFIGRGLGDLLTHEIEAHAVRDGELFQASAGISHPKLAPIVVIEHGSSRRVNGRKQRGPAMVLYDTALLELSVVREGKPAAPLAFDPETWCVFEGTWEYDDLSADFPPREELRDRLIECLRATRDLAKYEADNRAEKAAKLEARQHENEQRWRVQRGHEIEESRLRSMDVHDTIVAAGQPRRQVVEPVVDIIKELNQKQKQAELARQRETYEVVMARRPKPYGSYVARYASDLEEAESGRG